MLLQRPLRTMARAMLLLTVSYCAYAEQYTLTDLGTLGGNSSHGTGINISGEIVGYSALSGSAVDQAFLYSPIAGMQNLGTLGGTSSEAFGINSNGEVTGGAATPVNPGSDAFIYSNGTMTDIGIFARGLGINASGQVTATGHRAEAVTPARSCIAAVRFW
jgi:probable HAF family extracellular repeat protein